MRVRWGLFVIAAGLLAVPSHSFVEEVFYEVFTPGDPITDQSAGAPDSHSSLVGFSSDIPESLFIEKVARPAVKARARLYFVLNQCYSGGFIDDLARLGGTQFVYTAARHAELADYGYPPPLGVDLDSTDTFLIALANGRVRADLVAARAAALNPFGPNPRARRITEPMGSEHPQYFVAGGGERLKPAQYAARGIAVLWAGEPAARDGAQMTRMITRLRRMGFSGDRIWLLYGGGFVTAAHPIAQNHFIGNRKPIRLKAATAENLFAIFAGNIPEFVFLYVGDHGGLDTKQVAKPGFSPDPDVAPNFRFGPNVRIYGEG